MNTTSDQATPIELGLQQVNLAAISGAPTLMFFEPHTDVVVAIGAQGMLGVDKEDPQMMGFAVQVIAPATVALSTADIQRYVSTAFRQFDFTQVTGKDNNHRTPAKLKCHPPVAISETVNSTTVLVCFKLEDETYQMAVDVLRAQVAAIDRIEEAHTRAFIAASGANDGDTKH